VQVKEPGSPIWKGYATRYLDASQAMGLSASAVFVPAPSVPPPPPSPPPPQQHWVRGNLMRVSESAASPGGLESDKVGSATPRVSGDGNKVVFYSDQLDRSGVSTTVLTRVLTRFRSEALRAAYGAAASRAEITTQLN